MAEPDDIEPLLREARSLIRYLAAKRDFGPEIAELAFYIDLGLDKIRIVLEAKGSARQRQRDIRVLGKQLAKHTDELVKRVKRRPKYSTIEFKCLDDFEKCKEHRSEYDLFCLLSYLICILRRIIPFVRQTT
jgi:hypothetical protein